MTQSEKIALIRLAQTPGVGPATLAKLLQKYKSASQALKFLQLRLPNFAETANNIQVEYEDLGQIIVKGEEAYPFLLSQIPDYPVALNYRGDINALKSPKLVSIVGTRNASVQALQITRQLVYELAREGFTIVSGLAKGVDTAAHRAALQAGACTIAVLPGSLKEIYPKANTTLAEEIVERGGLLISELIADFVLSKFSFPRRNRIIAALSKATIVVQAPLKSGSLISAELALEYNREVFALPGLYGEIASMGSNQLIRDARASLLLNTKDVIDIYAGTVSDEEEVNLSGQERLVLGVIQKNGSSFDQILKSVNIEPAQLGIILSGLEIKSRILRNNSGIYQCLH